jgi:SGNH domain (fused to AT3 domains)
MRTLRRQPVNAIGNAQLSRKRRGATVALTAALAACGVAAAGTAGASSRATYPPCFGAASRDPVHRCENRKLKLVVLPTPSEALIVPDAPCTPIEAPISMCTFGVSPAAATRTIALIGDSHAAHWRAALEVAARRLRWSGISITQSSCPFTRGVATAPEPKRAQCVEWNRAVLQWFAGHPEVSTMVISDHPGPDKALPGQSPMAALVAGITSAWDALPATVTHIIVIRDVPFIKEDTLACVERAIARREDAGLTCAVPRGQALHRDPDVVAAERWRSPRVQVVDLTHFFCDSAQCYPVVGGALVYRDYYDHLTRVFSRTLGPFLLDQIERLTASWR